MKIKLFALLLLTTLSTAAQSVISGIVKNDKGLPLRGASISPDNTIDGTTIDSNVFFEFTTEEKGAQVLVATEAGHLDFNMPLTINGYLKELRISMKAAFNKLSEVVIAAGAFKAGRMQIG